MSDNDPELAGKKLGDPVPGPSCTVWRTDEAATTARGCQLGAEVPPEVKMYPLVPVEPLTDNVPVVEILPVEVMLPVAKLPEVSEPDNVPEVAEKPISPVR